MKSPARLGESAPRTSTPSTGVETRSAGVCCTLMGLTLGEGADSPETPTGRAATAGPIASNRVRLRSTAAPAPRGGRAPRHAAGAPRAPTGHLQDRHHRGQRRAGVLLVV